MAKIKRASVSEAKNGLSGLLSEVGHGAVLITHQGSAVARIEPCHVDGLHDEHAMDELLVAGRCGPTSRAA